MDSDSGYVKVKLSDGSEKLITIDKSVVDALRLLLVCESMSIGDIVIKKVFGNLLEIGMVDSVESKICDECGKLMIRRLNHWWCNCGRVESYTSEEMESMNDYYIDLWKRVNKLTPSVTSEEEDAL